MLSYKNTIPIINKRQEFMPMVILFNILPGISSQCDKTSKRSKKYQCWKSIVLIYFTCI